MVSINKFPDSLNNIPDPPKELFYLGNIDLLYSQRIMAIVGARKITERGQKITQEITKDLVKKNYVIISGMALGVDGVAHFSAINNGGKTIAVLGAGIDVIYPPQHKDLYHQIIDSSGLILSEYGPGVTVTREKFPARNRIVSGLSCGVIIIEGAIKSGSLITARLALDQGKDVFAVPGSEGTDFLIDQGATPILLS